MIRDNLLLTREIHLDCRNLVLSANVLKNFIYKYVDFAKVDVGFLAFIL